LAGTAVDVLCKPGLLEEAREEWRRDMEGREEQRVRFK
jgi:hypothetical protein